MIFFLNFRKLFYYLKIILITFFIFQSTLFSLLIETKFKIYKRKRVLFIFLLNCVKI